MLGSRRSFIQSGALLLATGSSLGSVISSTAHALTRCASRPFHGYGELVADPAGILDLPLGFQYRVLSRAGEELTGGGLVPSNHDGMGAFSEGTGRILLVRNHELSASRLAADGDLIAVPSGLAPGYDPDAPGGTTTLLVGRQRNLRGHQVSLSGTVNNCAGGPTPWQTWLTCEETEAIHSRPHGYVFEVDPLLGGNPEPIVAMGRFKHEAVSFDLQGRAYLTEDTTGPLGCFYRFTPSAPLGGRGSLHAGGQLEALSVEGVAGDLSEVQAPGTRLRAFWLAVPNPNPLARQTPVREQVLALGATPLHKGEGTWRGNDGSIWFVSSYADGPGVTVAKHSGQIWRYDPTSESVELVVCFAPSSPYFGPDNITAGPHGFALACTDADGDNWLLAIDDEGGVYPFARNAMNGSELAGVTFSRHGRTLFVNLQDPGLTFAIWGPWDSGCD